MKPPSEAPSIPRASRAQDIPDHPPNHCLIAPPTRYANGAWVITARAYGRHPQTDLVGGHRVVPNKIFARGGYFDPAPPTQCAAKKISEEARVRQFRSSDFCRALSDCATHCACLG